MQQIQIVRATDQLHKSLTQQRSEEVIHIVEHMPTKFGWIVTCIVFLLAGSLGLFGWLIKYPEILQGQISISAKLANVKIDANATGTLELFNYKNGDTIKVGDVIGMIKNEAVLKDIKILDSLLQSVNILKVNYYQHRKYFPDNLIVGELNTKYFTFLNSLYQYLDYTVERPFNKQKVIEEKYLTTQKKLKVDVLVQYDKVKKKMETTKNLFRRDSILMINKIISKSDFEKSLLNRINSEQEFEGINKDINNNDYQINEAANKLEQIDDQKIEKERELQVNLFNYYSDLKENIKEFERKYIFTSPIYGMLDFVSFLKNEDFVQVGQELFTVVPNENETIGQMFLPEQGSGKVKEGQDVMIKLDNYPFKEFGTVKGKVKAVSLVTNQQPVSLTQQNSSNINTNNTNTKISSYLVVVSLPNGLTTNYGSKLRFHFEAKGTAEIITDDRRLIQRLFDNLKYRLKKT